VIKPLTLIISGLATQRGAQAISADKVTQPIRDRILLWSMSDKQSVKQYERRRKINQLINCPHCTGFWLAALTLAVYGVANREGRRGRRTARGVTLVVEWWAVASIQTMAAAAWAMFTDVAHEASVRGEIAEHELKRMTQPGTTTSS
jgi:hypothetical protein